jgi:hypothetical protein
MVGRKISHQEQEARGMQTYEDDPTHQISTSVFHESDEQFTEGVKKDEGTFKHYLRNFYMPLIMVLGISLFMKFYQESYNMMKAYEDYLDWVVF